MKLLFLDIDGVMTNDDRVINDRHVYSFSKSCVEVLNQILRTHEVKIILTSSWRTVYDPETIHNPFRHPRRHGDHRLPQKLCTHRPRYGTHYGAYSDDQQDFGFWVLGFGF